jgi:uncharacterized protein YjbI with pentapeptide repeats
LFWAVGRSAAFRGARFSGGTVSLSTEFSGGLIDFNQARFSGGLVDFDSASFSGGLVCFTGARFSSGEVSFGGARFSGSTIEFGSAGFSGGEVDFSAVRDWSVPPTFPWTDTPPVGVKLPSAGEKAS